MVVRERNFSTFILGDDPAQLADGVLLRAATACSVNLNEGLGAYDDLISSLAPRMINGKLRESTMGGGELPLNYTANDVTFSGIEAPFDRSLWKPKTPCPPDAPRIAMGGLAHWQDFVAEECIKDFGVKRHGQGNLWIPVGARTMDTPLETKNQNVIDHYGHEGKYPTEKQYAERYVATVALDNGYTDVRVEEYNTQDPREIAKKFVAAHHKDLFTDQNQLVFAGVSHAVVHLANGFRTAARQYNGQFDADPDNPQVYLKGNGKPLARENYDLTQPEKYQSPYDSLYRMALTAKALAEARVALQ